MRQIIIGIFLVTLPLDLDAQLSDETVNGQGWIDYNVNYNINYTLLCKGHFRRLISGGPISGTSESITISDWRSDFNLPTILMILG